MGNHLWSGCAVLLSAIGLAAGVAENNQSKRQEGATKAHVPIPKQAVVVLRPTKGNSVTGTILLRQEKGNVRLKGMVRGLKPGKHGFHIHEFGDLRADDGKSAGGHFNPKGHKHGGPQDEESHAGDLGNIEANSQGIAKVDKVAKGLPLHFAIGRSIVVHAGADDLESQPSGDAGARVAVGVIGFASKSKGQKPKLGRKSK